MRRSSLLEFLRHALAALPRHLLDPERDFRRVRLTAIDLDLADGMPMRAAHDLFADLHWCRRLRSQHRRLACLEVVDLANDRYADDPLRVIVEHELEMAGDRAKLHRVESKANLLMRFRRPARTRDHATPDRDHVEPGHADDARLEPRALIDVEREDHRHVMLRGMPDLGFQPDLRREREPGARQAVDLVRGQGRPAALSHRRTPCGLRRWILRRVIARRSGWHRAPTRS